MQEEVENKTLTLAITTTKLTGRLIKAAVCKYLAHRKDKKQGKQSKAAVIPRGKQTVRKLIGQDQGVSNVTLDDADTRAFDRIARKYGIDYAIKKDRSVSPPKYLIFFKARDGDALNAALNDYAKKTLRQQARPSVLKKLRMLIAQSRGVKSPPVKTKDQEITR